MRRAAFTVIAILVSGVVTLSQNTTLSPPQGVDLAGSWNSQQWTEGGGPGGANDRRTFDFLGIPLNEAGKAWTLSHDESQLSEPERQCGFYTPVYHPFGFGPLNIWREDEYQTGTVLAWVIGGFQDFKPQVIWMDGRPHPGKYDAHRIEGFTTGVWENDVLTTYTTHMIANLLEATKEVFETMVFKKLTTAQPIDGDRAPFFLQLDPDGAPAQAPRRHQRGAAAHERIQDQIPWVSKVRH